MTILIAILILSAVIFFHELGHFLMAKANHVVVTEFAFGLGPRLLSLKRRYHLRLEAAALRGLLFYAGGR